ncbi:Uma2 family endonuclease [Anthocerotibacter panamensis]|uniref:Uma2 family endonuclease n=1 Tax=Anthocerotibacter panamensis TaxID=2857077 RepID=UPI001C401FA8|nr:Uma2 family endonuclease [Anthocerotibacter panamensis]
MPDDGLTVATAPTPDISDLVTEDDTPVDNFASEKHQRLLTEVLYSSWETGQRFVAAANVGIFARVGEPPVVPDMFLSLDVQVADQWWERKNRSYLIWEFGKPPEVVIELVSNREGNELGSKLRDYGRMRVAYYVVFDALEQLGGPVLQIFELQKLHYTPLKGNWLEDVGLGLTLWRGAFEQRTDLWLRWCDREGNVLLTGKERAERAEVRVAQAEERAARLAKRLQSLGMEPD